MRETPLLKEILLTASSMGSRLFRNNVGKCWAGKSEVITRNQSVYVERGDVVVRQARRFHAGLTKGSADLVGWTPTEITPEMVGRTVAIFTSVEVKTKSGRLKKEQHNFHCAVRSAGGFSLVARSVEEVRQFLSRILPSK